VRNAVQLVVAMLLPTAVGGALIGGVRLARWLRRRSGPAVPAVHSIERLAADARRLRSQLADFEADQPGPGRGIRVRALRAAYAEVLTDACVALDVLPPDPAVRGSAHEAEIYRIEAELRMRGLEVRESAAH
jgi:hypothetical protein